MKKILFFLLFVFLISPAITFSQIERVIVETYYISDLNDLTDTTNGKLDTGTVTYRIYVDLKKGNKLLKLYGDANHAIKFSSTKPFFNCIDGETYGKDLRKIRYNENTVALDTWLTLGQTARPLSGKTNFGILKHQDLDGSFVGGKNNDGGSALIAEGLLTNSITAMGLPLTYADGMDTMVTVPTSWTEYGIKDFLTATDSTMFGALKVRSEFKSNNFFLRNSGTQGVIPDSNQILIAQLTTKGSLTFELNLEVEQLNDGVTTIVKYVANDSILLEGERKSSFLKFPFPKPVCGCKDAAYLEYNPDFECADNSVFCLNRIVFGCMDTMACNFNPNANFPLPGLCCYPGSCAGRDISLVCPSVMGDAFDLNIYPNPAENTLTLNVTTGESKEMSYSVFNYFGEEVLNLSLGKSQRILNHQIDLSGLKGGLYLIRVSVGSEYLSKQFFKILK